jgi:hypothetical protein
VDWIHLVQNRDQRRALVNTVMNLFHRMRRISLCEQLSSDLYSCFTFRRSREQSWSGDRLLWQNFCGFLSTF